MLMQEVQSSNIKAIGYDIIESVVKIEFTTGTMYTYFDVPVGDFEALLVAESVGKHFNLNFKDKFKFEKI